MTDWSKYGAIDSTAVDPDQPLDAGVDHALAANEKEAFEIRGIRQCWSPLGGRKIASHSWAVIHLVPMILQPTHTDLDVGVGAKFPKGSGSPIDFRVQLTDFRHTYFDQQSEYDPSGSTSVETARVAGTLSQKAAQATSAALMVQMRPADRGVNITATQRGDVIDASRIYQRNASGDATDPASCYAIEIDNATNDDVGEIIQEAETVSDPDSGEPDDGRYTVVLERRSVTGPSGHHNSFSIDVGNFVTYSIELYSIDVELTHDRDQVPLTTSAATSSRAGPLAARQPYDATQSSYQHARTTKQSVERPRLLSMGYTGLDRSDDDNWPTDDPELWMYAKGDNGVDPFCAAESLSADGRGGWDWEVRLFLAAFDLSETRTQGREDVPHIEELRLDADEADWDITARIEQYQSGTSPTTINSVTDTYTLEHYPADHTGQTALPTQVWYLFNGHTQASSYPTDLAHIYREGMLYDTDFGILRQLRIRVPNAAHNEGDPSSLDIDADYTGSTVDAADAVLVGVGMSVWKVPP